MTSLRSPNFIDRWQPKRKSSVSPQLDCLVVRSELEASEMAHRSAGLVDSHVRA
jgi:hypothetical protein